MTRAGRFPRQSTRLPLREQLLYRLPMAVVEVRIFPRCHGTPDYPVCPRCGITMEREYMAFCSRCGQRLDWRRYPYARAIYVEPSDDTILLENTIHSR